MADLNKALVLAKEPIRESDYLVVLYLEKLGKFSALAKSARKINSKLNSALEPGNLIYVKFVKGKNNLTIIDAFKIGVLNITISDLEKLAVILSGSADKNIWNLITNKNINWKKLIKLLGWDPKNAYCLKCHSKDVSAFEINRQFFLCSKCFLKLDSKERLDFLTF
jgi:recombinational DNA repair protein (RecF pathway)